ncbi:hypothetical protein ABPG74_011609 [Tetrahymena malaccensis]
MIAPQAGFLPSINQQQNNRNTANIFQKGAQNTFNLPQINKYNQNSLHGYSIDNTINHQKSQINGYRPESQSQRYNHNINQPYIQHQNSYSPNRYPQNLQNQNNSINQNYQYNQSINDLQQNQTHMLNAQINQNNFQAADNQNQQNAYLFQNSQMQISQMNDFGQAQQQNQQFQQQPTSFQQIQNQSLQNRNYYQHNNDNNLNAQQMQYFYGQNQQQNYNNFNQLPPQNFSNQVYQNQVPQYQNGRYYGINDRERKSQSENSRNSQKMHLNSMRPDLKNAGVDNKQDLATALKLQMEEKKKRQLEEKEKNRLHELSLLNYNLKNSPFSKNQVNRQEQFIQKIKETSPNKLQQDSFSIKQTSINQDILSQPQINQPMTQTVIHNTFVPQEQQVDIDLQKTVNYNPQNQISSLNEFIQANQLSQIPQVIVASQVNKNVQNYANALDNLQINSDAYKTQSQFQKKSMIIANNNLIQNQEQQEKDVKSQKFMEYQQFLLQQIEEQKAKKQLEKQKKIEEELYYEKQFLKQLEQQQNKDQIDKYKQQQQYINADKANKQSINQNEQQKNTVSIHTNQVVEAKQSIEAELNFKRQSSAYSTISQNEESKALKKSILTRSQRSYTTNEEQSKQSKEIERSQKIALALQYQNQYQGNPMYLNPYQSQFQNQYGQFNIEQNQNIIEFQKVISDMMNQLTENQQHIQNVLKQVKNQSEENTKYTQNQLKEIQKLIIQQQTSKNFQDGMLTQKSFNTDQKFSRGEISDQQIYKTPQKLQQSPNQISQAVGNAFNYQEVLQKQSHHKVRSSHSVDRESIQSSSSKQEYNKLNNMENNFSKNTEPIKSYRSKQQDIADFVNQDKKKQYQKQNINQKINELNNDSVFLKYGTYDSSRPAESSQQNSISEGFHIKENGQENYNIPSNEIPYSNRKQKYQMFPVEEDAQSNNQSLQSSLKPNQVQLAKNQSGSKKSMKKSIKKLNQLDVDKVLEKNSSRLENLNELENKSVYIQHINFQNI